MMGWVFCVFWFISSYCTFCRQAQILRLGKCIDSIDLKEMNSITLSAWGYFWSSPRWVSSTLLATWTTRSSRASSTTCASSEPKREASIQRSPAFTYYVACETRATSNWYVFSMFTSNIYVVIGAWPVPISVLALFVQFHCLIKFLLWLTLSLFRSDSIYIFYTHTNLVGDALLFQFLVNSIDYTSFAIWIFIPVLFKWKNNKTPKLRKYTSSLQVMDVKLCWNFSAGGIHLRLQS